LIITFSGNPNYKYLNIIVILLLGIITCSSNLYCDSDDVKSSSEIIFEIPQLFEQGLYETALLESKDILSQNYKNHKGHWYLGRSFYYLGEFDSALIHFQYALKLSPDVADYNYWVGETCGMAISKHPFKVLSLIKRMKTAFSTAILLDSTHVEARIGLIKYYLLSPSLLGGDRTIALEHIEKLTEIDWLYGQIWVGIVLELDEKYDSTKFHYTTIISQCSSDCKRIFLAYGQFLFRFEGYNEAKEQITLCIKEDSTFGEAYYWLGRCWEALENMDQASIAYKQAKYWAPYYRDIKSRSP